MVPVFVSALVAVRLAGRCFRDSSPSCWAGDRAKTLPRSPVITLAGPDRCAGGALGALDSDSEGAGGEEGMAAPGAGAAIDGMSALLPFGASSPRMARWMVACGRDAVVQVPAAR